MAANETSTPDAPSTSDGAAEGAAVDLRYCNKCKNTVIPEGKGRCPKCGCLLSGNSIARKHPVNEKRRETIFKELIAEYQVSGVMGTATCKQLAAALERLDLLQPGSQEWARLVTTAQTLRNILTAAQPASPTPHLDAMPSSALERALPLLERLDRGEELTERELGQLDVLTGAMCGEVVLPPDRPPAVNAAEWGVPQPVPPSTPPVDSVPSTAPPSTPTSTPTPLVPREDPEELERRRVERFQTMLRTMGKPSPYL
jgi:hypothetical protein